MDATGRSETSDVDEILARIEALNRIGVALSGERDRVRLMEQILDGARAITGADGGTLYGLEGELLRFDIVHTESLGIRMGGSSGATIDFPPVPLRRGDGSPNRTSVVARAVIDGVTVNVPDAYADTDFDFSGTRTFDAQTGYRSRSMLAVPMRDHHDEILGVLQLLNATGADGEVRAFSEAERRLAESIASQAAIALTNEALVEEVSTLFESFVKMIAAAIDEKSPHTGNHCRRIPELTMMIAEAAHRSDEGELASFAMGADDRYELRIAAWLHDCGKIATPEHLIGKATKLEGIVDRIEVLDERFAAAAAAAAAAAWRRIADGGDRAAELAAADAERARLVGDLEFLRRANRGSEGMSDRDVARVEAIGRRTYRAGERERPLLAPEEIRCLTIRKGTLLEEERELINRHIVTTIEMLESLPFPRHLARVPEFAGGHHEHMDGSGYPRGLRREEMSLPARIMGVADVFEALTSADRPYKEPMGVGAALEILARMVRDRHVDPDVFRAFVRGKVHERYARRFLRPEQREEVDEARIFAIAEGKAEG